MKIRIRKFVKKETPESVEVKGHILKRNPYANVSGDTKVVDVARMMNRNGMIVAIVKVVKVNKEYIYSNT